VQSVNETPFPAILLGILSWEIWEACVTITVRGYIGCSVNGTAGNGTEICGLVTAREAQTEGYKR
jgi:hypothetical protein